MTSIKIEIPAGGAFAAEAPSAVPSQPTAGAAEAGDAQQSGPSTPASPTPARSHGLAFLLNVQSVEPASGIEILPGHVIRRADPAEITVIKATLEKLAMPFHRQVTYFWEHRWPHQGGTVEILPQEEWRYFVLAFEGTNATLNELASAFTIAEPELFVGFFLLYIPPYVDGGIGTQPAQLFHTLEQTSRAHWHFHSLTSKDGDQIRALHASLKAHDDQLLDLHRVVMQLSSLNGMPYDSPLRFLGYFALLECLLTHVPKQTDPYDSITRQVKKKLALLNHRLATPIDYSYFGNPDGDTLWGKMYSLRSAVAHGGKPDLAKDLKLLKSQAEALTLLQRTTKAIVRHALKEPQLLVDLKEC